MEGVQILNTYPVMVDSPVCNTLQVISAIFIMLGLGYALMSELPFNSKQLLVISAVMSFVGIVLSILTEDMEHVESGNYQYEALISDEARWIELATKYELIEKRGEIWVLQERSEHSNEY